jgi:hypothetical protein
MIGSCLCGNPSAEKTVAMTIATVANTFYKPAKTVAGLEKLRGLVNPALDILHTVRAGRRGSVAAAILTSREQPPDAHLLSLYYLRRRATLRKYSRSGWCLSGGWWLMLLAAGWAMILYRMRNLRMMIYRQCAHRNMWGRERLDVILVRRVHSRSLSAPIPKRGG